VIALLLGTRHDRVRDRPTTPLDQLMAVAMDRLQSPTRENVLDIEPRARR
jgi:hypothetical protein